MTHITTPNHLTWQWFCQKLILQRNSIYIPISTNVLPRLVSFAQETIGFDLILRKEVSLSCVLQFLETCCQVVWNIEMSIDFNVLYFWGLPHISFWRHNTKYCNHPQKWKSVKDILCSLWVQNAVWNFNAVLWNFTENFEPLHQNMCILWCVKFFRISYIYGILNLSETGSLMTQTHLRWWGNSNKLHNTSGACL